MSKLVRRAWLPALCCAVAVAALATHAVAKPKGTPPKGKVEIKDCAKKKQPVTFDHAKHVTAAKNKCEACHHLIKGKPEPQGKCSACHTKPQGSLGTCQDMSKTKNPLHKACIGCHQTAKKETAPTKCAGCHR